jgi:hypothetical protein
MPELADHINAIWVSGLSIYDPVDRDHALLWLNTRQLEELLNAQLKGEDVSGLPLRTRSKHVKSLVCRAMGYPVPRSFKRTHPQFPGQDLDVYVQKSNNVQIWNESIHPERRYAMVHVNASDKISGVRVITGATLARLDSTGTLTGKYQARCVPGKSSSELIATNDTKPLLPLLASEPFPVRFAELPSSNPSEKQILPIAELMRRMKPLLGTQFENSGDDQERNRGAALHGLVCRAIGYPRYHDDGQFPDVRHQLLEVKLQTAQTIDLGLVSPASIGPIHLPGLAGHQLRHCDMRYVIFYGRITEGFALLSHVTLTHVFVTTGEKFYTRFPAFKGKVVNRKNQIALPSDFWQPD